MSAAFDVGDFVFAPQVGNSFVVGSESNRYLLLRSPWSTKLLVTGSRAENMRKATREPTDTEVAHFMNHMLTRTS